LREARGFSNFPNFVAKLSQALSASVPTVALQGINNEKHNLLHGVAIADLCFGRISLAGAETVLSRQC
jgi:hypothetical protein